MFTVIVFFKTQGQIQLLFEHHDHARRAFTELKGHGDGILQREHLVETVSVSDDYGTEVQIDFKEIRAVMIQDHVRALAGHSEFQLAQTKQQAVTQKKAMADPALRILTANGPIPGFQTS